MFEVGASTSFRAFHRMPDHPPPENERHPHDYRVEVVAERERLDERGMVCDLDVLTGALAEVADRVRDRDLSETCGTEAVTVEVLAERIDGASPIRSAATGPRSCRCASGSPRTRSEASVRASEVGTRREVLQLSLVTLGDPDQRTGGYRYHRMMAAAAADHGASVHSKASRRSPGRSRRWPGHDAPRRGRRIRCDPARQLAAAFAAPWIARLRTPVIAVAHQPPGGLHGGRARRVAQRRLDGIAYRSAAGIIVAAESLVDDLRGVGVPADRIVVVPPGCDVPVASGPPLDLRRGRAVSVLCVANWTPLKGILELVDAFATLPEGAATLWLVGATDADTRYAERVRRRVAAPDLRDRVVVRGSVPVEEVGRLYRSADVFALCSFVDAYGTAWAEAIAAGLPVVGWRAGNLPRLAEHGREALMAEPGDLAGLASALRAITTDGVLRARLAAGARRRAASLPTWRDSAQLFFASVRELLS